MLLESSVTGSNPGRALSAVLITRGLLELNRDVHFDMPNKLSDASFVFESADFEKINSNRQGIYWGGRYVCGLDRGTVTEFKMWEEEDGVKEVSPSDADILEEASCVYIQILPSDSFYNEALLKAERKDDNFTIDADGKVFKWTHFIQTKVRGRIIRVGWRHTFENLIGAGIPGITRATIAEKFGVNMDVRPFGPDAGSAYTEE